MSQTRHVAHASGGDAHARAGLPEEAASTWGRVAETGSWAIDTGIPEDTRPAALRQFAETVIWSFLVAFRGLCRVVRLRYDVLTLDAQGQTLRVAEGQSRRIEQQEQDAVIRELLAARATDDEATYFTQITLECDMWVLHSTIHEAEAVWVADAGRYSFSYVLEEQHDGHLVPVDSRAVFTTAIDAWVPTTLDLRTLQRRANHGISGLNAPVLRAALACWEALLDRPIAEATSSVYQDQIVRAGFPGGESVHEDIETIPADDSAGHVAPTKDRAAGSSERARTLRSDLHIAFLTLAFTIEQQVRKRLLDAKVTTQETPFSLRAAYEEGVRAGVFPIDIEAQVEQVAEARHQLTHGTSFAPDDALSLHLIATGNAVLQALSGQTRQGAA